MSIAKLARLTFVLTLMVAAACSGNSEPAATTVPPTTAPPAEITQEPTQEPVETTGSDATPTQDVMTESQSVAQAVEPTAQQFTADGLLLNAEGVSVVAVVNNAQITQPEFQRAMERASQQIPASDMQALGASVIDNLIEQALIEQAAVAQGIVVTDEEIEAEYQENRTLVESDDQWNQWLSDNQYTEEEFRESLRAALIASKIRDMVTGSLPEAVMQVHARHILVGTEAEAQQVLQRLQNGEDFATVAAEVSKDVTTREQGGDLGWFMDGELLQPGLSQAAFSLEPGQIAGPLVTSLGYHIIQT
ncbi:MAG: peptidylprolyl isomerase, partial [Anaerolineae bacterium]|nr:peptidylprolyl isomerase [Anaerolineae bacterium]